MQLHVLFLHICSLLHFIFHRNVHNFSWIFCFWHCPYSFEVNSANQINCCRWSLAPNPKWKRLKGSWLVVILTLMLKLLPTSVAKVLQNIELLMGHFCGPPAESPTTHNTSNILLCLRMNHVLYIGYIQHNQNKLNIVIGGKPPNPISVCTVIHKSIIFIICYKYWWGILQFYPVFFLEMNK